jgi:hypothetical protein
MEHRQKSTLFMNHDAKIHYYKEQIQQYQYLIDQEEKKSANAKSK